MATLFHNYETRERKKGQRTYKKFYSYIKHIMTINIRVHEFIADGKLSNCTSDVAFLQSEFHKNFQLQVRIDII